MVPITGAKQENFDDEVQCFKALYEAKINDRKSVNDFVKVAKYNKENTKQLGLYLISAMSNYYCELPKKPSYSGKSFNSYDLSLNIPHHNKVRLNHVEQFNEIDFSSTIGRMQRFLASKTYTKVSCTNLSDIRSAKRQVHNELKLQIKKSPRKYIEQIKGKDQFFTYELDQKYLVAKQTCRKISSIKGYLNKNFQ